MGRSAERPRLYCSRWTMLAILSGLALLSDWICFSVAPIPAITEAAYQMHPATLVTIFLTTNVMFCFIEPLLIMRRGLRRVVRDGAWLMFIGCLLRGGLPGLPVTSNALVVLGTIFVGAAQPFFQCTPAMLAANWFGADERTLATTIAINANQLGIAMSYMVGSFLVHDTDEIHFYFLLLSTIAAVLLVATICLFQSEPPTPASHSSMDKTSGPGSPSSSGANSGSKDFTINSHVVGVIASTASAVVAQMKKLLVAKGFNHALIAFVISIGITNVISTFLDHMLGHLGFTQHTIGIIGALFQVMIMIGSVCLGYIVDKTKLYYRVTMFCFGMSFFWLFCTSDLSLRGSFFIIAILFIGFFVGPIQPITAEIAVEVTYPADENAIVAVQQVFGNMFSALLVPFCNAVRHISLGEYGIRMDYLLLLAICGAGGLVFSTFNAPLKRLMTETAAANDDPDRQKEPLLMGGDRTTVQSPSTPVVEMTTIPSASKQRHNGALPGALRSLGALGFGRRFGHANDHEADPEAQARLLPKSKDSSNEIGPL